MTAGRIRRRELLKGGGLATLALSVPGLRSSLWGANVEPVVVTVGNNYRQGQWYFDPVGIYLQKGQTVRWQSRKWGANVAAYHPDNGNEELRIPVDAKPFDSGLLGQTIENTFEWTFAVEGTYDYFCRNHKILGMVGRIVVGSPGGPAEENAPGYGARDGRAPVYPAEKKLFDALPSSKIVTEKSVPYPRQLLVRRYPYSSP